MEISITEYNRLKAIELISERITEELEIEKKLNAEIKARFVKCNTCTDEMKSKCLMFSENLCEGERCEELIDLMSLISKSESDNKLDKAIDLAKDVIQFYPACPKSVYLKAKSLLEE